MYVRALMTDSGWLRSDQDSTAARRRSGRTESEAASNVRTLFKRLFAFEKVFNGSWTVTNIGESRLSPPSHWGLRAKTDAQIFGSAQSESPNHSPAVAIGRGIETECLPQLRDPIPDG